MVQKKLGLLRIYRNKQRNGAKLIIYVGGQIFTPSVLTRLLLRKRCTWSEK